MNATEETPKRCPVLRQDGSPCEGKVTPSGFCVGHDPRAREWRRRGGAATSRAARAERLLPVRLRPIADLLEKALREIHGGKLAPAVGSAMAAVAGALIKVTQTGDLEERLRKLENLIQPREALRNGGQVIPGRFRGS